MRIHRLLRAFAACLSAGLSAYAAVAQTKFDPVEQWKAAVLKHDAGALKSMYSSTPPTRISTTTGHVDTDADVAYWTGLKARSMSISVAESGSPQPGVQLLTLQLKIVGAGAKTVNVVEGQAWQDQGGVWRMVAEKRDVAKLSQPTTLKERIYPTGNAREQIQQAVASASKARKNILLVFGADWCYDCHVLEKAFHRPDIAGVLNSNYQLVDIDIGNGDKNLDVAAQYQVPLDRGVPAIAILDKDGKLLFSQKHGEWERARGLGPEDVLALLKQWKPER
jgi:hypothetical protein